jgi:prepilin-type N-terminal cleavage/methylation domain-containing protein
MHKRSSGFTLIEIMIVIMIIGLLATLSYPTYAKARENARRTTCLSNLRLIQGSVDMTLFESPNTSTLTLDDIRSFFSNGQIPSCPANGNYTVEIRDGALKALCDYSFGHEL